ncbi:MAG TPA: malto-oligosyltrehalose synthase [Burkholderiaceae bacterium]|nr:malto-oligosyltrehalose synthase [Burkholderiaceae bacterium]
MSELATDARIPRATYRIQFNRDFTFDDALAIVPYLAELGISHLYCSPLLRARAGSTHGYDIVAHSEISPEIGGMEGFERLAQALQRHSMGLIFDVVPNHMGVLAGDNQWWMDVLENGQASAYAHYFDIDWNPVNPDLHGKVLVAVLGDHYGHVLDSGQLRLEQEDDGGFAIRYYQHRLPIDPREYAQILGRAAGAASGADAAVHGELNELEREFAALPARAAGQPEAVQLRRSGKQRLIERLRNAMQTLPSLREALQRAVEEINADAAGALHRLLEAQAYRLAYWRVASDEINYRRFFDINELAALRMEHEEVFEATHDFVLSLAARGVVDGLRIDHPDGLYDPRQYFARLQQGYARRAGLPRPQTDQPRPQRPIYVLVEKITAHHEDLPADWAVHGTTGYRYMNLAGGVFVDTTARSRIDRIWRAFTGRQLDFEETAYLSKRAISRTTLASELAVLATELQRIARMDRRTRDFTLNTLRYAIAEVAACMPIYRTYIVERPSPQDSRYIDWAVGRATRRSRTADPTIFGFVRQTLLGQTFEDADDALRQRVLRFAARFQQFSSPLAAKGVEDTSFYLYNRLTSLNEVGGDPGVFGTTVRAFHAASADRAARWPATMLATSTHDNKRSEDVRQRINVLSELPAAWRLLLRRWRVLNRTRRTKVNGEVAPSPSDEYLLYQTLLGTFPPQGLEGDALAQFRDRIEQYMMKAVREAKERTSWINPDAEYEAAVAQFVRGLLARPEANPFLDDLRAQSARIAWFGALNSVSLMLLKYTSPGVPDLYQGNELFDYSLVDPDNRRPVDYQRLERLLGELRTLRERGTPPEPAELGEWLLDGRAKLWTTWRLLDERRRMPELFRDGNYQGLEVSGARANHVLAYARRQAHRTLIVVSGRMFAQLLDDPGALPLGADVWADASVAAADLPDGAKLTNLLTGESVTVRNGRIAVADAMATFPAAALLAVG